LSSVGEAVKVLRNTFKDDWRVPLAKGLNHIITKQGELVEYQPNKHQITLNAMVWDNWINDRPTRIVHAKCRQYGASTNETQRNYDICAFIPGIRCLMLADQAKNSAKIFSMLKLTHDEFNPILRSEIKANNATILEFKDSHSRIEVDTAENRRAGMGGTYMIVHASEVAWYSDPDQTMLSVMASVPKTGRSIIVVESTANGVGNYFHKLVMDAKNGLNDWTLYFVPWYDHDEYSMPLPTGYILTPEESGQYGNEIAEQEAYNLTPEQLYWRRYTIANDCQFDLSKFKQEYPGNVDEAFIGSGYPVFNHHKLGEIAPKATKPPKFRGYVDRYNPDKPIEEQIHLNTDNIGNLRVWELPDVDNWDNRYLICADTGGVWEKADNSCAYVMDRLKGIIAAELHGHIDAYEYADQLDTLSRYYNNAKIAPEINKWSSETDDQGETLVEYLRKRGLKLYTRKVRDDQTKEWTTKIGWHTNAQTKGLMVDKLRQFVNEWEDNPIICNDIELINEMRTYIVAETKTGKTAWEAQDGHKDDRVMAFGICLCLNDELAKPERKDKQGFDYKELYKDSKSITNALKQITR
jgi:hypothetical protein